MEKRLRISWIIALGLICLWLGWQAAAPLGTMSYRTDFKDHDYFISRLTPLDRILDPKAGVQPTIIAEPVYFSVYTPRPFDQAKVTVDYNGDPAFMELGVRRDPIVWNFERKTIASKLLDSLAIDAGTIREGNLLLWQRTRKYDSVADFFSRPPARSAIAAYNVPLDIPYAPAEYSPLERTRGLDVGLRGTYTMNTYSAGDAMAFDFLVRDINGQKDPDPITALVYRGDELVASVTLEDDGGALKQETSARHVKLSTGRLTAGVYRIEFRASDDIVTDRLSTAQRQLSLAGRIWLAEAGRSRLKLYTDSARLDVQTTNPASRQTLAFGEKNIHLDRTYQQVTSLVGDYSRRPRPITVVRDDITLAGDGVFAFSEGELLNPSVHPLPVNESVVPAGIDYVIASYDTDPANHTATFDLSGAFRPKGAYSFMIAIPGVEKMPGGVTIRSVRVDFSGQTLWEIIRRKLSDLL